jgi:hypothetical protein
VAKLNAIQRIDSIERRIADYEAHKEVNSRDVELLLTAEQKAELAEQIRAQQELRKQRRPERLARYEALHKNAASLWARCRRADTDTEPQQQSLLRLQNTCSAAIRQAHADAVGFLDDEEAQRWMDRVYERDMQCVIAVTDTAEAINQNQHTLQAAYDGLPMMVSSTSTDVRCTQAERFEWLSKPELRKRMLQRVLLEHEQDVGAVYEHEQKRREVRAASVMLDAYFGRIVELTGGRGTVDATQRMSAWSMASRALQQNGFRGLGESRAATERDKEVWAMEDELRARFEAEATAEEREQLALLREMEAAGTKKGKHRG